jgi:hypothetical protein
MCAFMAGFHSMDHPTRINESGGGCGGASSRTATSAAVQIVGGRSAHRRCPLERLFRDVRTATLMPPNADRSAELIGKAMLDITDEVLLARHAG